MNNFNRYINKNGKKMRYGYTTGSCAAAASKAAVSSLFLNEIVEYMTIDTPKGWMLDLEIEHVEKTKDYVICSVIKDSGDDPDVTHGISICAKVEFNDIPGVLIDGGIGVGRVTKKGLRVPVGKAAINPVPLEMIENEVLKVLPKGKGVKILIFVPEGKEISKKTFNEKLGIIGGISILGTSGIVEPMSEDSFKESLKIEMNVKVQMNKDKLIFVFGNFGTDYLEEYKFDENDIQKTSNFVKYMIEAAKEFNIKKILFVGHAGKMVKLAYGMGNTHSKYGDNRMLSIIKSAKECKLDVYNEIINCNTTDEAVEVLREMNIDKKVFKEVINKCKLVCENFSKNKIDFECIVFSTIFGTLGKTTNADQLLKEIIS